MDERRLDQNDGLETEADREIREDPTPDTSAEAVAWTVNKDAERPKTVRGDWQDTKATLCAAIPGYMDLPATERQILWDLIEVIVKIHPTMTFKCGGCGETFSRVHQYKCSDCDGAYCKSCIVPHFEHTGTEGKPYKHIPHPSPNPDGLEWWDKEPGVLRYKGVAIGLIHSDIDNKGAPFYDWELGNGWSGPFGTCTTEEEARSALESAAKSWLGVG